MSGSYERVNYLTSFGFSIRWRKQFLKPLQSVQDNIKVLDLMTGMGETWHPVKKHYPNCIFTALDFSEGMLNQARKKNKDQFQNSIIITNQNALECNFPDQHFDIILSAFGLKTFNQDQLALLAKETYRLLKPGGTFSFIEVSQPENPILIVLVIPSPQPGLTKKVNEEDLLPFSQTRRLLASMFIASALLLIIIGHNIFDLSILRLISIVRVTSFALVIALNANQYQSKRWKPAPLIVLMSIFSLMSFIYLYFIFKN